MDLFRRDKLDEFDVNVGAASDVLAVDQLGAADRHDDDRSVGLLGYAENAGVEREQLIIVAAGPFGINADRNVIVLHLLGGFVDRHYRLSRVAAVDAHKGAFADKVPPERDPEIRRFRDERQIAVVQNAPGHDRIVIRAVIADEQEAFVLRDVLDPLDVDLHAQDPQPDERGTVEQETEIPARFIVFL